MVFSLLEFPTCFHNFTTTFLIFIECCGDVPQNINFFNYRGTFSKLTRSFSQHTVYVICNCTPLYTFSCFLGYTYSNYRCFYTTYSLCSSKTYPDISFFIFLGVRVSNLCFILYHILYCNIKM